MKPLGRQSVFPTSSIRYFEVEWECAVSGTVVIHGCVCALYLGRVATAGRSAEAPVQECDAGELWPPGLPGISTHQT